MQIDEGQLKKFIAESKLVSRADLDAIANKAQMKNQKFSDLLLSEGKISEIDLKKMEAFVLGIPFIGLTDKKIDFSANWSLATVVNKNGHVDRNWATIFCLNLSAPIFRSLTWSFASNQSVTFRLEKLPNFN